MSAWNRLDGREPQEHRRRVLFAHQCTDPPQEDHSLPVGSSGINSTALLMAPDARLSYSQGGTSLFISLSGPTTSKQESAYDKAQVVLRLHPRVGLLAIQPMSAVGAPTEKRRFIEARHQTLQETYAAVLLPLLQSSVETVLCLEQLPRCVLMVDVLVLEEDGGLLPTVLNGVMCAMLEAGWPCRSCFAAVSVAALSAPKTRDSDVRTSGKKRDRREGDDEDQSSSLWFVVDPTALEETLCGHGQSASTNEEENQSKANAVALAAAQAATTRGQLLKFQRECRTVAVGTFIVGFRPRSEAAIPRYPTIGSHIASGSGAARALGGDSVPYLKPIEWLQMEEIAVGAAHPVFEFFRKLNVPLE